MMTNKNILKSENKRISKEYRIEFSTKNIPIIDIALTEFMSAVFKEFHNMNDLWGNSTNIIRISDEPLIYRVCLASSNTFFINRSNRTAYIGLSLSECMDEFLKVSYEINFLELKVAAIVYDSGQYRKLSGRHSLEKLLSNDTVGQFAGMLILR